MYCSLCVYASVDSNALAIFSGQMTSDRKRDQPGTLSGVSLASRCARRRSDASSLRDLGL
jgi:hypothetical protein